MRRLCRFLPIFGNFFRLLSVYKRSETLVQVGACLAPGRLEVKLHQCLASSESAEVRILVDNPVFSLLRQVGEQLDFVQNALLYFLLQISRLKPHFTGCLRAHLE